MGRDVDVMLDELTRRAGGMRHALVLSGDGMVTAASTGLERAEAERLAAVASGLHSLARGTGQRFGAGRVRQTMVEFEQGVLFVTAAGERDCLCVLTGPGADLGAVAYEMTSFVRRVGELLKPGNRGCPQG
ncbi:dynein regulation protein LC7 [Streptomyces mashuensis]|uniref:Dynein regulation protein LC7 n=2 Tax=Streptomyces mashuensis TaxID=33904 RepID=A0A919E8X3_9ACTN|nr:dynein regulation protein LC7 [Streptomyces mashuensis]